LFNKKAVFVLGAGASAECGLPLGATLKQEVGKGVLLKNPNDAFADAVRRWTKYDANRVAAARKEAANWFGQ
jgi:hypothetical protein